MLPLFIPIPTQGDRNPPADSKAELRALREEMTDLQRRLDKQAVLLRALFALLADRNDLSEADLLARFRDVEAGRAGASAKSCPQCGRSVNQRTQRCVYCGAAGEVDSAFELLELGPWPALRPFQRHGITTRPSA